MGWSRTTKHGHLPFGIRCLYAAELANGIVKVGLTRNPRGRIPTLHSHARIRFGAEVVRHELSAPFPENNNHLLWGAEQALLNALRRIAHEDSDHGEYFRGIAFDVVLVLMEQVVLRFVAAKDLAQAPQRRIVGADPVGFDSLIAHGPQFCPGEPRNATQLRGDRL
jgi:hypothetical protein